MTEQLSNKEKVIEFSKRLLINVVMNALPGSVQLLVDAARDFNDLFLATPESEQNALIDGAQGMSEAELELAHAEIARDVGIDDEAATQLVLESLRGIRRG